MCLLVLKVHFAFIALMQKRPQKQVTVTLNARVKAPGSHGKPRGKLACKNEIREAKADTSVLDISNSGQHFLVKN